VWRGGAGALLGLAGGPPKKGVGPGVRTPHALRAGVGRLKAGLTGGVSPSAPERERGGERSWAGFGPRSRPRMEGGFVFFFVFLK
jgi:hypothetical protein